MMDLEFWDCLKREIKAFFRQNNTVFEVILEDGVGEYRLIIEEIWY